MTRAARRATVDPDFRLATIIYTKELFLGILKGMLKSKQVEEQYIALQIQEATDEELDGLAQKAAEYYVDHTNPSLADLPRSEIPALLRAAIDHALRQ